MITFLRVVSAESLKLKRSLALLSVILAPVFVVGMMTLNMSQRPGLPDGVSGWEAQVTYCFAFWTNFLLPLFVTLVTALIGGLEHKSDGWTHLFALPVSRWQVYVGKIVAALALVGLASAVLGLLVAGSGRLLEVVRPTFDFDAPIPWGDIARRSLLTFLGTWGILTVHAWLGMRSPSFVVAIGGGIAAWIALVIASGSKWLPYYPWAAPGLAIQPEHRVLAMGVSGVVFLLALLAGGYHVTHRDVS